MTGNSINSNHEDSRADEGPIEKFLPSYLKPFAAIARLDRPTGTWLLLWPCFWSLSLASNGLPEIKLCAIFALGAILMRSAGCTYNDIIDRNIDGKVKRTQNRPIPSGRISLTSAIMFLILLLTSSLILLLQLNTLSIWLGLASIAIVFTYPIMKRITYWPQLVLGLAFSWGALLGWTASSGSLEWPALLLYIGGIFWTLGYDTIYAFQDKDDDAIIGVKSSALALGEKAKKWIFIFYFITIFAIGLAGFVTGLKWPFWLALFACGLHFSWQLITINLKDSANCASRFRANSFSGGLIFIGILGDKMIN